jgi:hypothetical protein
MVMPDELSPKLDEFDFLAVQSSDDLGSPVFMNEPELLTEIHLVHSGPTSPPYR